MLANLRKWITLAVLLGIAAVGALIGRARWQHSKVHISTEDAYVQGDVYSVASRVAGTLGSVNVANNQPVKSGDVLAEIDPRDFDAAISKAVASVAEAESGLASDRAQIAQSQAQVKAAQSQLDLARTERARIAALYDRQSIPKQKLDQAEAQEELAQAQLEASGKAVAAAEAKLTVSRAKIEVSRAALEVVKLQRAYCTIVSPVDGFVSRKSAEAGQVVAPGQPLCAVVPLGLKDLWIEANFKETQLTNVRPGQRATIRADIDPEREFTGTVESISAGTGAAFSLLPSENATGNWVKIVQRVSVRIRVDPGSDPNHKLRLGLSVSVVIDTTGESPASTRPS